MAKIIIELYEGGITNVFVPPNSNLEVVFINPDEEEMEADNTHWREFIEKNGYKNIL